jgi:hypothetical protein
MITKQCLDEFNIGGYRDEILCDVIPWMYVMFFGRDHRSLTRISFMMGGKYVYLGEKW